MKKCKKITMEEPLPIIRAYTPELKERSIEQHFGDHPKNRAMTRMADKMTSPQVGRPVTELGRNLPPNS